MNTESFHNDYQFHIDMVTEERVSGWAFKKDNLQHHPVVEVHSGDVVLWRTEANQYREDLMEAGFSNGEYGFILVPTAETITQSVTSVSIYIDGILVQEDIPFSMAPVAKSIGLIGYRVQLDHYDAHTVRGWVFKEGHEQHRVKVEVRSGDVVVATGFADNFREDLLDASIGDGAYGFSLTPRLATFTSTECECELYVDDELSAVGAFVLQADQESIDEATYKEVFASEITDFAQAVDAKMDKLSAEVIAISQRESKGDFSDGGLLTVAMNNIAELSARVKIIENILVKRFLDK